MLGSDHYSVGKALDSLAQLYQEQGFMDRAAENYDKALKILQNALGVEHPQYLETKKHFDRFCKIQKDPTRVSSPVPSVPIRETNEKANSNNIQNIQKSGDELSTKLQSTYIRCT